jgi:DNA-binding CsgD family transcriptional regulator
MLSKTAVLKIEKKRIESGMTKRQLADKIGYSYWYVTNIIKRKTSSDAVEFLLKKWSDE